MGFKLHITKVLRDLVLETIKELCRNNTFFNVHFRNEANEYHESFIELGLSTHYVEDLLHVAL